jgi:hypothetical protein
MDRFQPTPAVILALQLNYGYDTGVRGQLETKVLTLCYYYDYISGLVIEVERKKTNTFSVLKLLPVKKISSSFLN